MKRTIFLAILAFFFQSALAQFTEQDSDSHVLLVSFDGFRSDYVERWDLPNFKRLVDEGASAKSLIPAYPSITFPNHYTLVTGLYPGNHGIVANNFYRAATDSFYSFRNSETVLDQTYYGGLPLWQYVQQYGKKSASMYWVGSEAPIQGRYPDYYEEFNPDTPNDDRITRVMEWIALPESDRPSFVSLYFSLVDATGHNFGPNSPEVEAAARESDRLVGRILTEIEQLSIPVNLIIVSDHGLYPLVDRPELVIDLDQFELSDEEAIVVGLQYQTMVYARNKNDIPTLYEKIRARSGPFQVFLKEETPAHWHYREHENVGDIIIVANPGYRIFRSVADRTFTHSNRGIHGYDARDIEELHGIFYSWGPQILPGSTLPSFESIHVFPLVTELLQLPQLDGIDGELEITRSILRQE